MGASLRIATFNLENFDDKPGESPSLAERVSIMKPQLIRLNADILCLQEVNGQEQQGKPRALSALASLIQGTIYEGYSVVYTVTTKGEPYDVRNLVLLSRFPISTHKQIKHEYAPKPYYRKVTAIPPETEAKEVTWERPILYATIELGQNRTLHLINVHLKSKIPCEIPGQMIDQYTWKSVSGWAEGFFISSMRRVGQALETRILIDKIFDAAAGAGAPALIVVCGDFNSDIEDIPVSTIRGQVEETGNPALLHRIMIPCELSVPESSRYTLLHLGKGQMLDHVLVSRPLLTYYKSSEIDNEILPDESGAFRTDVNFPESDHAPVVAEFLLP